MSTGSCTEFATALVCYDDGATSPVALIAHYEYGTNSAGATILVSVRYTLPDGTPVDTSPGVVTAGACATQFPPDRIVDHSSFNIASGSFSPAFDPGGIGTFWSYSGSSRLQSITVTALRGEVPNVDSVQITHGAAGTVSWLVEGQSVTFSVAQHESELEILNTIFAVECLGSSAAHIALTEEI